MHQVQLVVMTDTDGVRGYEYWRGYGVTELGQKKKIETKV